MPLLNTAGSEDTAGMKIYTVAEITRRIRGLLEDGFPAILVRGEISNLTRHTSGHIYFTLKDEAAQIRCVIWRSTAAGLSYQPQDGASVLVQGRIAVYEKGGNYQITVQSLQPEGLGALQQALEKLKKKLYEEGLFDERRKKPLPPYPERVGVVTSPTGAAIRDIVSVLRRRMPGVTIILAPVKVQGEGAEEEIVAAIRDFERYRNVDVLIVGRGGGSLEDLWAFNDERVARAIDACSIPVISAVGHEIDFTIADFVADVRAATPSAAAELAVPDRQELLQYLQNLQFTMEHGLGNGLRNARHALDKLARHYAFRQPEMMIARLRQQTDELERRLIQSHAFRSQLRGQQLEHLRKRLEILNPQNTLKRGFVILRQNHRVIPALEKLDDKIAVTAEFYDGWADMVPGPTRKK